MGRPSISQIRRAKERAEIQGKWGVVEQLNDLEHRIHAEREPVYEEPVAQEPVDNGSSQGFSFDLPPSTAEEYTSMALGKVSSSDYKHKCKHCSAKPFSEGPHHDSSCSRHQDVLSLSTEPAHRYKCKHCEARPFVAGAHHKRDCPRRIGKHVEKDPSGKKYDYSTECKHCGAKPFSQGPHHDSSCKRNWSYTAYSTKLAHKYYCSECEARPFVAGPHHESSCKRYIR